MADDLAEASSNSCLSSLHAWRFGGGCVAQRDRVLSRPGADGPEAVGLGHDSVDGATTTAPSEHQERQSGKARISRSASSGSSRRLTGPAGQCQRDRPGCRLVGCSHLARSDQLSLVAEPEPAVPGGLGVFTRPGAEQRIRRLLALPGLNHAARQLKTAVGAALLRTGPDRWLTLTAYGQPFTRDVPPALDSPAQSRSRSTSHAPCPRPQRPNAQPPHPDLPERCSTTPKTPAALK